VLLEDPDPAVSPIDLLVLDLQHLATTTARVEGSDDSVAHLVASGQLDLRIPDVTADDRAAHRSRDLERGRDLPLLDASLRSCSDLVDIVPGQLRHAARRFVQELARLQEPLFLGLGHAPLSSAFTLGGGSDAARMKRRLGEEIATDRPVADVTQPSQVTIRGRDRAVRVSRLEVLDRVRAFERRRRQSAELSAEDIQLTQHPSPALERLDLDVASAIELQQVGHRRRSFERCLAFDRHAEIFPGDDLGDELRFPDLLGFLFGRDRCRRASRQREVIDGHSVASMVVHDIQPPRMLAARARLAAFAATRLSNSHTGPPSGYETFVGIPRRIQSRTSAGWNLLPLTPKRCETSRPRKYARRTVSS
jgi:hypothetical protein